MTAPARYRYTNSPTLGGLLSIWSKVAVATVRHDWNVEEGLYGSTVQTLPLWR